MQTDKGKEKPLPLPGKDETSAKVMVTPRQSDCAIRTRDWCGVTIVFYRFPLGVPAFSIFRH